jgi:riboflavin synthase
MFTGIITETTTVKRTKSSDDGLLVTFAMPMGWQDLKLGESINTDGACLTVAAIRDDEYDCMLVPETLSKTTFGISVPKTVNLERALAAGDRFGGHFVQGHVDGVGKVTNIDESDGYMLTIDFDKQYQSQVISKGSITINGVSLTVTDISDGSLSVALIPHTLQTTTHQTLKVGDPVNLEFDVLGKYVANLIKER